MQVAVRRQVERPQLGGGVPSETARRQRHEGGYQLAGHGEADIELRPAPVRVRGTRVCRRGEISPNLLGRQRTGFRVELTLEPAAAKQPRQLVARGDADSFLIRLKFPETDRYRPRSITLFHEQTWQSMLDYARGLSAPR